MEILNGKPERASEPQKERASRGQKKSGQEAGPRLKSSSQPKPQVGKKKSQVMHSLGKEEKSQVWRIDKDFQTRCPSLTT